MSSCSCVYVDGDCVDQPTVFHRSMREASCAHVCVECGRRIAPGEKYERVFGIWLGESDTQKTCTDCLSIRSEFFCDGAIYGQMLEDLFNHLNELEGRVPSDCLANLTPRALAMVCEHIEDIWRELDLDEEADGDDAGGAE